MCVLFWEFLFPNNETNKSKWSLSLCRDVLSAPTKEQTQMSKKTKTCCCLLAVLLKVFTFVLGPEDLLTK